MKIILLIIASLFLLLGLSALLGQTSYLNLPFSIGGAEIPVAVELFVGATLFFVLSRDPKKEFL